MLITSLTTVMRSDKGALSSVGALPPQLQKHDVHGGAEHSPQVFSRFKMYFFSLLK